MRIVREQSYFGRWRQLSRAAITARSTPQLNTSIRFEQLEERFCLAAAVITDTFPAANAAAAAPGTQIVLRFDDEILVDSLSDQSLIVHSVKTGRVAVESGDLTVDGEQIVWRPQQPFMHGDEIHVTAGIGLQTQQGETVSPSVWQFRVATGPAKANFNRSDSTVVGHVTEMKLGDVDGDGDLDVIGLVTRPGSRSSEILVFRNDGLADLGVSRNPLSVGQIRYIDLADIDGDGDLDVVSGDATKARIYFNDSTGSFKASDDLILRANEIAIGDLNEDGFMDIYAAADSMDQVWLQSPESPGIFEYVIQTLGTSSSSGVVLGDLDQDGDLDSLVMNREGSQVWLNDGTGRFRDSGRRLDNVTQIDLGDLDGDGDLDAFTNGAQTWFNSNQSPGLLQRQLAEESLPGKHVELGDVDGDGNLDAVVITEDATVLAMNDGLGILRASPDTVVDTPSSVVAVGDLDRDGDLDIVTVNNTGSYAARQSLLSILTNVNISSDLSIEVRSDQSRAFPGSEVRFMVRASNHGPQEVENARVILEDAGSLTDLQISCEADLGASCPPVESGVVRDVIRLPAQSSVTFTITARVDPLAHGSTELRGRIADANGLTDIGSSNNMDAEELLIVTRTMHPAANTAIDTRMTFSAKFTSPLDHSSVSSRAFVIHGSQSGSTLPGAHTLTSDGRSLRFTPSREFLPGETIQVSMPGQALRQEDQTELGTHTQQYRVSTSGGTGLFRRAPVSFGRRDVVSGDMDRDGDLDVVAVGSSATTIYYNDGSGQFDATQQIKQEANSAVVGDLDGDGDTDILFAHYRHGSKVWINQGDQRFGRIKSAGTEVLRNRHVQLVDIDSDGDLDVLSIGDQSMLLLNDGAARFSQAEELGTVSRAFVADFQSDGRVDMLLDNQLWRNVGDAQFVRRDVNQDAIDVGDVDGDGDIDLIGRSSVAMNDGRGRFDSHPIPHVIHHNSRLGDIDGDDDLDVVGPDGVWINNGQADFSKFEQDLPRYASDQPILGDFDGDGDLDMVLKDSDYQLWINADIPADLSVDIPASQTFVLPGQKLEFRVIARNDGPWDTFGASLHDTFPIEFTDVKWDCEATAGSTCTASGRGDIIDELNLLSGGTATYTVSTTLASFAFGSIQNTAAISTGADGGLDDFDPSNDAVTNAFIVPGIHVAPPRNSHVVDQDPRFTLTFESTEQVDGLTVSDIIVHGFHSGIIDITDFSVDQATVTFELERPLQVGERFEVTIHKPSDNLDVSPPNGVFGARVGSGLASAHFVPQEEFQQSWNQAVPGDFDGDGDVDLIVVQDDPQLLLNDGFGNFEQSPEAFGGDANSGVAAEGVSVGDVDQDGDLDVLIGRAVVPVDIVGVGRTRGPFLWLNNGRGQFTLDQVGIPYRYTMMSAMSDLDGDGDVDLILSDRSRANVLLNEGAGQFHDTRQVLRGAAEKHGYRSRIAIGDVDGDDDMDLAYRGQILVNDGTGVFTVSQDLEIYEPTDMGDVDGDGDLDLFAGGSLWWNNGAGEFRQSDVDLKFAVALRDVDGDGDLDAFSEQELWLNNGRGTFRRSGQNIRHTVLAIADFDGDRDLDVVTRGAILFNVSVVGDVNSDGVFDSLDLVSLLQGGRYLDEPAYRSPVEYQEGDFNRDGRFDQLDLVYALQAGPSKI